MFCITMRCASFPLLLVVVAIAACGVFPAAAFSGSRTAPSIVNTNVNPFFFQQKNKAPVTKNPRRHRGRASGSATAVSATPPFVLSQIGAAVRSSPVLKNCIMCMWLSAIGDVLAQRLEQLEHSKKCGRKENSIDPGRVARLATFGFVVSGPLYSTWYPFLDRLSHAWSLANYGVWTPPIVKMVLEMIFIEPLFLISFFGFMHFVGTRNTLQSFTRKIRAEFVPTYKTSLTVWPPFMLLSFRFVPLSALPSLVNVANTMWDAYLSYRHSITANHPSDSPLTTNATTTTTTSLVDYPTDAASLETCPACS
jgi:hypothetical protein